MKLASKLLNHLPSKLKPKKLHLANLQKLRKPRHIIRTRRHILHTPH